MAVGNRTETKANVTSKIASTVVITKHVDVLNNDMNASTVFRKDVIITPPVASGNFDLDCDLYDQAAMTITGDVNITFSNLKDGDIAKKLIVNKNANNTVSFSGISGTVDGDQIGRTSLHFSVWSANSKIFVTQINSQSTGNIVIGDLAVNQSGTIDSLNYGMYNINRNMCYYELNGTLSIPDTSPTSPTIITVTISNLPFTPQIQDIDMPAMFFINVGSSTYGTNGAYAKWISGTGNLTITYSIANPQIITLSGQAFTIGGTLKVT